MSWKRFFFVASLFWSAFFSLALIGSQLIFVVSPLSSGTPPWSVAIGVMCWMAPLSGVTIGGVMTILFFLFPFLEKRLNKTPQLELPL